MEKKVERCIETRVFDTYVILNKHVKLPAARCVSIVTIWHTDWFLNSPIRVPRKSVWFNLN